MAPGHPTSSLIRLDLVCRSFKAVGRMAQKDHT
jgi:hypothetical protein